MEPLLDIIIPIYNGEAYVRPLLETFRRQGYAEAFRLLFINDGSTDGTLAALKTLPAAYPFETRTFTQENAGVSAARNRGLQAATAPFVAFLDADDRVTPDYIKTLLGAIESPGADALLFGQQRTDGAGDLPPAGEAAPEVTDKTVLLRRFAADPTRFGAVNLLLRRAFLEENGLRFAEGYPYYEDYHFLISALAAAKMAAFLNAPLYDYVRRPDSAMARFSAERLGCLSLLDTLPPLLERETPAFAAEFKNSFVSRIYWSVLWQACLAAPDKARFLSFAKATGARFYLSKLKRHPDKTAALSAWVYLSFPGVYYAVMRILGRRRSAVAQTSAPEWDAMCGQGLPTPNRVLLYGMSHVRGGVESYLRALVNDAPEGAFDFLCDFPAIAYQDEMAAKGCRVHFIPPKGRNPLGHLLGVRAVLRDHPEYETVYLNLLDAGGAFTALVPFLMRRRVAVHSHSSKAEKPALHRAMKPLLNAFTAVPVACSAPAADHMFRGKTRKRTLFVPNRIRAADFRFDPATREKTRTSLGLSPNTLAVMHVGRPSAAKNLPFLAALAKALKEENENSLLISVGSGDADASFDELLRETGAETAVLRLGAREDIPALLQAADALVLPSLFEGFPMALVEAQAAGLPCFASDRITPETKLTDLLTFLPIDRGSAPWTRALCASPLPKRRDTLEEIRAAGFDRDAPSPAYAALLCALNGMIKRKELIREWNR